MYVNIIVNDYIRTILGLNRTNSTWCLDPRVSGPGVYSKDGTPMGVGNQVSLEFNLVYRWHATVSERDDKWTRAFTAKVFPGKDVSKLTINEFREGLYVFFETVGRDCSKWNLDMGTIVRDKNTGKFDDAELIKLLSESTRDCAGINSQRHC